MLHSNRLLTVGVALIALGAAFVSGPGPAFAATITVDSLADTVTSDGDCTLREALENANDTIDGQIYTDCEFGNAAGADAIVFSVTGTIELSGTALPVTQALSVTGTDVTIDGSFDSRIFDVSNAPLDIHGLTLLQGNTTGEGGAINSVGGDLTLSDCQIGGNTAAGNGGAIHILGASLDIDECDFLKNQSDLEGGVIYMGGGHPATLDNLTINAGNGTSGGCIRNSGEMQLTNVAMDGCDADADGGAIYTDGPLGITNSSIAASTALRGAAIFNGATAVEVEDSTFSGNSAGDKGGAIYSQSAAEPALSIDEATFTMNTAVDDGGAIYNAAGAIEVTGSSFTMNSTGPSGVAGAIDNHGEMEVSGSEFAGNTASASGAIRNAPGASGVLFQSSFTDNNATESGGAVSNVGADALLFVARSTFHDNLASSAGGAIYTVDSSSTVVLGSTFDDNSSPGGGGAILNGATMTVATSTFNANGSGSQGGAIFNGGNLTVRSATIAGNSAPVGGGLFDSITANVANTLFAGNTGGNCSGTLEGTADTGNLSDDDTCTPTVVDQIDDAMLGPLADNGGPTFTRALLAGSPAIDAGGQATCDTPDSDEFDQPADQRGLSRTVDGDADGIAQCDVGAFELQVEATATPTGTATGEPSPTGTPSPTPTGTPAAFKAYAPFAAKDGT